jgi:hypothetical protein
MARSNQAQSAPELEESLREFESTVREYVKERPLTAVTAAFAAGYVLGGGLTPRLTWMALTAAGRMSLLGLLNDVAFGRPVGRRAAAADGRGSNSHAQ